MFRLKTVEYMPTGLGAMDVYFTYSCMVCERLYSIFMPVSKISDYFTSAEYSVKIVI
jgi:hypothetical protein